MLPRFAKIAYNRRYWSPPRGATHVLQWFSTALLQPEDRDHAVRGWWEIWPLAAFLAGEPDDSAPDEDGPADRTEDDLRGFVDAEFGEDAIMAPFEVEIKTAAGAVSVLPAYWLTPAGGGR
jgi:hypothetical protein